MISIKNLYDSLFNKNKLRELALEDGHLKYRELILRNELKHNVYEEGFFIVISTHYYFKTSSVESEVSIVLTDKEELIVCNDEERLNISPLVMGYKEFKDKILDSCAETSAKALCHKYDNDIIETLNEYKETV